MRLKLFDVDIYISCLFAAIIAFLFATDRTGLILPTFAAILFHELGHLFAMWGLGCQPKQINLIPASVQIVGSVPKKNSDEVIIALMGPLMNLLLFVVLLLHALVFDDSTTLSWAVLNLVVCIFNLLPARGLDGGTILYQILLLRLPVYRAELILRIVTFCLGVLASMGGVTILFQMGNNPTLLLLGIYLLIASLMKI